MARLFVEGLLLSLLFALLILDKGDGEVVDGLLFPCCLRFWNSASCIGNISALDWKVCTLIDYGPFMIALGKGFAALEEEKVQ